MHLCGDAAGGPRTREAADAQVLAAVLLLLLLLLAGGHGEVSADVHNNIFFGVVFYLSKPVY